LRRRASLTFQHHAELCALPDEAQDYWLDRAIAGGWSCHELRRHRRAAAGHPRAAAALRLSVDGRRADRWREAARLCACDVEEWSERVLDEAAEAVLRNESRDAGAPIASARRELAHGHRDA